MTDGQETAREPAGGGGRSRLGWGIEREDQKVKGRGSLDSDFWWHAPPGR